MTNRLPFQTIGKRYRIVSTIGAGGMGAVYRVTDRLSGKTVALKHVLLDDPSEMSTAQGDDLRVSLTHEFRTLASLHHPNVINVLDHGFDEDRNPFFTMELLEGGEPITDVAKPKAENDQVALLIQLLEALWYLHRRNVVHRDLKPANVLVSIDGQVKVLDFGLAAVQHTSMRDAEESIAGTLAYMAPEILMQNPASAASDLWAVGVMAYEIFRDKHPFGTGNLGMMIQSIVNDTPDLSEFAAALAEVMRQLLSKKPAERYVDARKVIEELCEAVNIAIPEESVVIRESFLQASQFVGREEEMAKINDAIQYLTGKRQRKAATGEKPPHAWLIAGESGVGKSRLIDEIRVHALVSGTLVLQGAGVFGGGLPFQLWRDPMRRLVLDTELDDLDVAVLKEIVPDIEELIEREVEDAPSLDRDGRVQRLIGTLVEVFRRQTRPVVLIVEDLQWAVESLEPLKLLTGLVDELPLLIVGNYRNDERPELPDELPGMSIMKLERLPQSAIEKLSAAMLGDYGRTPEIIDLLNRETEGNALFIIEVMRALAEEAGGLGSIQSLKVPAQVLSGGIREILRRRLNLLPETHVTLLKLAAVAGRNLDMPVIAHILDAAKTGNSGLPQLPSELDAWLVDCANSATLESVEDQWRFAHDKLREVLVDNLTDTERKEFNRQVALAIEAVHPDNEGFADQLADLWHMADNIEKEAHFANIAAEQLLAISSFKQCEELLDRTLKRIPESQLRTLHMKLLKHMGDTYFYLSDYAQSEDFLTQSVEIARELKDRRAEAEALRMIASSIERRGDHKKARDQYNAALSIWQEIGDQRGIADTLVGLALIDIHEGDLDTALQQYEAGLKIFREEKQQRMTVVCLVGLANVALNKGDLQTAETHLVEGLEITRATGDRFRISTSLNNLGVINEHLGNIEQAKSYYQQSLDLSREIGDRQGVSIGLTNLGVIAEDEGRYMDAQQHYQDALESFRAIGDKNSIAICLQNLGNMAVLIGDYPGAMKHLEEALTLATEMNDPNGQMFTRLLLGNALRQSGMVGDAKEHAEVAIKLAQEHDQHGEHAKGLSLLGHSAYDLEQYDEAVKHFEAGVKLAREHDLDAELGTLLIRLAFAQLQLEKNDAARLILQEALSLGKSTGSGPLTLQALTGFARLRYNNKERAKSMQILNVIERQFDALQSEVRQWIDPLYGDLETLEEDDEYLMPPELDTLITELLDGYTPPQETTSSE